MAIVYGTEKNYTGTENPSSLGTIKDAVIYLRNGRSSLPRGMEESENGGWTSSVAPTGISNGESNTNAKIGGDSYRFSSGTAYIILGVLAGIALCALIYFLIRYLVKQDNTDNTEFHTRMPNTAPPTARRGVLPPQQQPVPIASANVPPTTTDENAGNASTRIVDLADMPYDGDNRVAYSVLAANAERDEANFVGQRRNLARAQYANITAAGVAAAGDNREIFTGNPIPLEVAVQVQNIGGVYVGEDNYVQI